MVTLLVIWFIANIHLFAHDTTELSAYELFYMADQERNAHREQEMNELLETLESSVEYFTVKEIKKALPRKVGAAKFYTQAKNSLDLEYDEEPRRSKGGTHCWNGHKRIISAVHGTHGSKGQRKAKFRTQAYQEAREYKRSRYQLEQTQLTIS